MDSVDAFGDTRISAVLDTRISEVDGKNQVGTTLQIMDE